MLAIDTQIKQAFEVEQMLPEQIAEQLGLETIAVKAKLMQVSHMFRKMANGESPEKDDLNFSDDQLKDVNAVIYQTAMSAEFPDGSTDYRARFNAATYIRDDIKGRKDVVKGIQQQGVFNIVNFNQALQAAKAGASDAIRNVMGNKQIEV